MRKEISYKIVSLVFSILVVCFALSFYILAWTEPGAAPPGGNVPAPLNVSIDDQVKQGNLIVNALGVSATGNALLVPNGNVGIGTTSPETPAPNAQAGNLDVNDVYLRSTSSWLSAGGGGVPSAPVIGYNYLTSASNTASGTYQDCITVSVNLPAGSTYTIMAWGYVGSTGPEGALGRIRLVIDGTGICENEHQTNFRGSSTLLGRKTGVASGARTVKIQQKMIVNGSFIDWRSLLVMAIAE